MLDKPEVRKLLNKLGAEVTEGTRHTHVAIQIPGADPVEFGLSRGKRVKDGHVAKVLKVSSRQLQQLARCSLKKEWYLENLVSKRQKAQGK